MARERTHPYSVIPAAVSAVVDRIAGCLRGRRAITAKGCTDRALLERQKVAMARTAGILKDAENPDWETPEKTSAWVRKLRGVDNQATDDKLSSHLNP